MQCEGRREVGGREREREGGREREGRNENRLHTQLDPKRRVAE
jgi:hypothetical protein